MPSHSAAAHYRPDIDGLRAVAVSLVVLYHFFPLKLKGGFVGVDIFFVISGFLISKIILSDIQTGTFRIHAFYARRIRRIFPALTVTLLACLIVGWQILLSDEFEKLGSHTWGGATFMANWMLWQESGYFDVNPYSKPLMHLWSLGVEEQFYILWPLLLWFSLRRLSIQLIWVLSGLSLLLSIYQVGTDKVAAFYSPLTRFWELAAGSLLAYGQAKPAFKAAPLIAFQSHIMGLAGCVLLAFSLAFTHKDVAFPGAWALPPVLGTVLLVAAGPTSLVNRRLLSHPWMVWLGLISFPLYLWHWPILSFIKLALDYPGWGFMLAGMALSVLLAWLTWMWIEKPIRKPPQAPRAQMAHLIAGMVIVAMAGAAVHVQQGFPARRMAQKGHKIVEARQDWQYDPTRLVDGQITGLHVLNGQKAEQVIYLGSSYVGQFFPRAEHIYGGAHTPELSTVFASRNDCTPIPSDKPISPPENIPCAAYYRAALALAMQPQVVKVVLGGDWALAIPRAQAPDALQILIRDLSALKQAGKTVYILARSPYYPGFNPRYALFSDASDTWVTRSAIEDTATLTLLHDIARQSGAHVINPFDYLCDASRCQISRQGDPLYKDAAHIRASYARSHATFIDELSGR